jgi:regulatory protein
VSSLFSDVESAAIRLLARREHSQLELSRKLVHRQFPLPIIEQVIRYCIENNYQSDLRYAQMIFRARANHGYGPYRIQLELKSQGVAVAVIEQALNDEPIDWFEIASITLLKHIRNKDLSDNKQRNKSYRFMQQKGFSGEQVAYAFETLSR